MVCNAYDVVREVSVAVADGGSVAGGFSELLNQQEDVIVVMKYQAFGGEGIDSGRV